MHFGTPIPLPAGGTVRVSERKLTGFLPTVSGTLSITMHGADGVDTLIVDGLAVTDGIWVDIPITLDINGATFVATGAAGLIIC